MRIMQPMGWDLEPSADGRIGVTFSVTPSQTPAMVSELEMSGPAFPARVCEAMAQMIGPFLADRGPADDELPAIVQLILVLSGFPVTQAKVVETIERLEKRALKTRRRTGKLGWISALHGPLEAARALVAVLAQPFGVSATTMKKSVADDVEAARCAYSARHAKLANVCALLDDVGIRMFVEFRGGRPVGFGSKAAYLAFKESQRPARRRRRSGDVPRGAGGADLSVLLDRLLAPLTLQWPTDAQILEDESPNAHLIIVGPRPAGR